MYIQTGLDPPFPTNIVLRILEFHQQLIIKGNLGERSDWGGGGLITWSGLHILITVANKLCTEI
jgi:hypothetical protein